MKVYYKQDEVEKIKYVDVDAKVKKVIMDGILKAKMKNRDIDWKKLKVYCMEYFNLPESTIDRAMEDIKKYETH